MLNQLSRALLKWTSVSLSCFTMILAPVAMGREAENISIQLIEQQLKESGLDKKQTLGQFWEKNKSYFPSYVVRDLEQFITENQNVALPEVTTTISKTTDGTDVPTLRYTMNGKTYNLQVYGEKNRWARLNGVDLSEDDFRNVEAVYKRLEASDLRIKKEADAVRDSIRKKRGLAVNDPNVTKKINQIRKDLWRFTGFPRVTPDLWRSMNKEQRAGYIVHMRQMVWTAKQVLDVEANRYGFKNTAQLDQMNDFYQSLLGAKAYAQSGGTQKVSIAKKAGRAQSVAQINLKDPNNRNKPCIPNAPYSGRACIAAGFVDRNDQNSYSLTYNSNSPDSLTCGCSYEGITSNRPEKEDIQKLANECADENKSTSLKIRNADKGAWVACNPLIYSYQESGKPNCVHTMSPGFQMATTFSANGSPTPSCDEQSRLSASPFSVWDAVEGFAAKDTRLAQIEKEQRSDDPEKDFLLTKKYLNGALKRGGEDKTLDELLNGEWSEKLDSQLIDLQKAFENEIEKAIQLCSTNIGRGQEPNHLKACEQLHRRWLLTERFIAKLRQKACDPAAEYIGSYKANESGVGSEKTKTNLTKIDDLRQASGGTDPKLCACTAIMVKSCDPKETTKCSEAPKLVKFGEKCGTLPVVRAETQCPAGMSKENYNGTDPFCLCSGAGAGSVPLNVALDRASLENGIEKMCNDTPPATDQKCGKPQGISGFNYEKCACDKGELVDDNEQGFISKLFTSDKEPKEPNWICKESSILPWLIGGGLLALLLFLKNKKDRNPPIQPPPSCAPKVAGPGGTCICPANNNCSAIDQRYDMETCTCSTIPKCQNGAIPSGGLLTNCPKCGDGSYVTGPSTLRPNGCPGEGGSGSPTCTDPNGCNGGVPGRQ